MAKRRDKRALLRLELGASAGKQGFEIGSRQRAETMNDGAGTDGGQ
jgi:hypothetical protein